MDILIFFLLIFGGYICGNISFARILTNKNKNKIEGQGSGNPGTMNMLRTQGAFLGAITLFFDALKGAIPAVAGLLIYGGYSGAPLSLIAMYVGGLSAVVGHIFPVFYKFKGGKGIATSLGVFFVADPLTTGILFAIMFVIFYFIKVGSLVSLFTIFTFAFVQIFKFGKQANWIVLVILGVIVLLDTYAHRQNIIRLLDNIENESDLEKGLQKDLEKIRKKKETKFEKLKEKEEKIETSFEKKKQKVAVKQTKLETKFDKKTNRAQKKAVIKSKNRAMFKKIKEKLSK